MTTIKPHRHGIARLCPAPPLALCATCMAAAWPRATPESCPAAETKRASYFHRTSIIGTALCPRHSDNLAPRWRGSTPVGRPGWQAGGPGLPMEGCAAQSLRYRHTSHRTATASAQPELCMQAVHSTGSPHPPHHRLLHLPVLLSGARTTAPTSRRAAKTPIPGHRHQCAAHTSRAALASSRGSEFAPPRLAAAAASPPRAPLSRTPPHSPPRHLCYETDGCVLGELRLRGTSTCAHHVATNTPPASALWHRFHRAAIVAPQPRCLSCVCHAAPGRASRVGHTRAGALQGDCAGLRAQQPHHAAVRGSVHGCHACRTRASAGQHWCAAAAGRPQMPPSLCVILQASIGC